MLFDKNKVKNTNLNTIMKTSSPVYSGLGSFKWLLISGTVDCFY